MSYFLLVQVSLAKKSIKKNIGISSHRFRNVFCLVLLGYFHRFVEKIMRIFIGNAQSPSLRFDTIPVTANLLGLTLCNISSASLFFANKIVRLAFYLIVLSTNEENQYHVVSFSWSVLETSSSACIGFWLLLEHPFSTSMMINFQKKERMRVYFVWLTGTLR